MKKSLLFSLLSLIGLSLFAQNPEYYNTNTVAFVNNFPLGSATNNKAQWIFGPNQFYSGGTGSGSAAYLGNISKIYIKLGNTVSVNNYTNFTISLGQNMGTSTSFGAAAGSSYNFVTGLTPCFYQATGFNFTGGVPNGWFGIPLQASFPYNPNLSLVVEIKVSGGSGNNLAITNTSLPARLYGGYSASTAINATGILNFGVNMKATPLPVQLARFEGIRDGQVDRLQWTTSSETNNSFFNLQHSADGINFLTIAKVNTRAINGNSTHELQYEALHNHPLNGHNYYRLQQVDINGVVSLNTDIVDLFREGMTGVVNIFPNPATDVLNLDLNLEKLSSLKIMVIDMQGRIVHQMKTIAQSGFHRLPLDISNLFSGQYLIQANANDRSLYSGKFIRK